MAESGEKSDNVSKDAGTLSTTTADVKSSDQDDSWVVDSLMEFLNSATWRLPVLNFIDKRSVVFDSEQHFDDAEHRTRQEPAAFLQAHSDYKQLIDLMLGTYMQDIGISAEQLEHACNRSVATSLHRNTALSSHKRLEQQRLFELIWAADDFQLFKRMMTRANIELQLQVIDMLQRQHASNQQSSTQASSEDNQFDEDEMRILREAMRKSSEEHKEHSQQVQSETVQLNRALEESELERRILHAEKLREQQLLEAAVKMSLEDSQDPSKKPESHAASSDSGSLPHRSLTTGTNSKSGFSNESIRSATNDRPHAHETETASPANTADAVQPAATADITASQLEQRRAYLRQQRDRLLARKQQERRRLLDNDRTGDGQKTTAERPRSSRAARQAIDSPRHGPVDPDTLTARRQLAQTLRTLVVDKSTSREY